MNNAHNKFDAAASAQVFGRYSLVRRVVAGCLLGCAFASAAHAGPEEDQQRAMQQQRAERQVQERHARQFDTRQFDARAFEQRAEEQRRQIQVQQEQNSRNADSPRRGGHMTADERRDLRRQINEAGMDLYPNARRR